MQIYFYLKLKWFIKNNLMHLIPPTPSRTVENMNTNIHKIMLLRDYFKQLKSKFLPLTSSHWLGILESSMQI